MRVNITNISGKQLSTSVGNVDVGSSAVFDISPDKLWKAAAELEAARIAGYLTYRTSSSTVIPDGLETATVEVAGTRSADVSIPAASVQTLFTTPYTLVAAPGANKALVLEGVQLYMGYVSAAYAGIAAGEDLSVKYTNASGAQLCNIETTGFLDQTTSQLRWAYPHSAAAGTNTAVTPAANAPLVMTLLVGDITTGDSPLKCRVFYRVVPTTL